jgi:hypothetical protein
MAPLLHSVRDEQFEARAADTLSNRWVKAAVEAARGRDHGFQSSPFAAEAARLERERGAASRAGFLRQALRGVIAESRPQIASLPVPDEVKANFRTEFERIEKETSTATGFGRIPMRFGHIEVGGVPRRHLIRGGVAQALSLGSLLASVGGHAPFYVSHFTHTISPLAFLLLASPERVVEGLRTVGECLKLNPHIRGLLATSWWYDPQLTQVAPHLAYLRETSVAHGALLVRAGRTDGAVKMALANSPQRQRLYDEGRYFPESYALVWSRQSLLKLAASTPSPGTR